MPEDAKGEPRLDDKALEKLYKYVNNLLKGKSTSSFFDISDVLKDRNEAYYIDFVHITEKGNEVVAERIYKTMKNDLVMPLHPNK